MPITTIEEAAQAIAALQTTIQSLLRKDVGLIVLSSSATPPADCVPCDGHEYDITDPANAHLTDLLGVLGKTFGGDGVRTFQVPELRGEFIRVLDDGKRPDGIVDPLRTLGSWQAQASHLPASAAVVDDGLHDHTLVDAPDHQHDHDLEMHASRNPNGGMGNTVCSPLVGNQGQTGLAGRHGHVINMGGTHHHPLTGWDGETRPRNAALAAYIRF